jgi:dTDP-4-amino-4,6-dideoxygalactose transaminase
MQLIDLASQYQRLKLRIDERIQNVLNHGQYINGPEVEELEQALCNYTGSEHCLTCANGTDALQLALMALEIGPGDAVVTTAYSFFATAEVISLVGATPIFVDVDADTFNLSPSSLRTTLESYSGPDKLKAIITVDLFGLPANYPEIKRLADKYDLFIIEDAAQGFGGKIDNRFAGTLGDVSTTSFFPAKPLGCYGDGGAIFTPHENIADRVRSLKNHGLGNHKYDNVRIGINSRLDTIQAAILLEKLDIFESEIEKRNEVAGIYENLMTSTTITPKVPIGFRSAWAQYTILVDNRDLLAQKLHQHNIPYGIYYRLPLHQQKVYSCSHEHTYAPNSEALSHRALSLPMHPYLTIEQLHKIVGILTE